jgi:hypothetical protein
MAEGQFTWQDSQGREVFVRNLAIIVDGRYHVVQVLGPGGRAGRGDAAVRAGAATYQATGLTGHGLTSATFEADVRTDHSLTSGSPSLTPQQAAR